MAARRERVFQFTQKYCFRHVCVYNWRNYIHGGAREFFAAKSAAIIELKLFSLSIPTMITAAGTRALNETTASTIRKVQFHISSSLAHT